MADCLAQPDTEAGIMYGATGVCHQIANRILYPANVWVNRASGVHYSIWKWGAYGKDPITFQRYSPASFPWPELSNCLANHLHP